ncbi:MAG: PepSY domain-containing protein [Nitrospirota bacterium]
MKQLVEMVALAIGVVLVLNGPAWSDQKIKGKKDESKETVEMAAKAKVTIDQAIKTASEKVAGKVVEAELEKKHDTLVWEVEVVTAENKVMEVHIDAESGAVIDVEEEKSEKDMKSEQKRERKQQHKP